jgi:hypothetical protein
MSKFTFEVQGLKELNNKLKNLGVDIQEEVVGEIQAWGNEVNAAQLSLISQQKIQDLGALQQNTKALIKNDGIELVSNVYYAPFIEFGTGPKIKIPGEISTYAAQFKGKKTGSFKEFVNKMKAWLKRNGYNEKLAYIAALNKIKNGSEPRPYFFDPIFKKRKSLIQRINAIISDL